MSDLSQWFTAGPEDQALAWLLPALRAWGNLAQHFKPEGIQRVVSVDPEYLLKAGSETLQVGGILVDALGGVSGVEQDTVSIYLAFVADYPRASIKDGEITFLSLLRELRRFLNAPANCDLGGAVDQLTGTEVVGLQAIEGKGGSVRVMAAIEAKYSVRVDPQTQEKK